MSQVSRLSDAITAIGADIKTLRNGKSPAFTGNGALSAELSAHIYGGATLTLTLVADRLYLEMLKIPRTGTLTDLVVSVTTAAAGKRLRGGIYSFGGSPAWLLSLVAESSDVSVGATGQKNLTLATPLAVTEGEWMAVGLISDGAPTVNACGGVNVLASPFGVAVTAGTAIYRVTYRSIALAAGWTALPAANAIAVASTTAQTNAAQPGIAVLYSN